MDSYKYLILRQRKIQLEALQTFWADVADLQKPDTIWPERWSALDNVLKKKKCFTNADNHPPPVASAS